METLLEDKENTFASPNTGLPTIGRLSGGDQIPDLVVPGATATDSGYSI